MKANAQKLEDRLIEFAAMIMAEVEVLPNSKVGNPIDNHHSLSMGHLSGSRSRVFYGKEIAH